MNPGQLLELKPGESYPQPTDAAGKLHQAMTALDDARRRHADAYAELEAARKRECTASNDLNAAQRAFDEAVVAVRKACGPAGSDWARKPGKGEPGWPE